ncbi:unnamed protein product [Periconia digitata]|uniref:Uncharacterized protein n=1 Tax=Periconia digitata TaxID=1303443 RepID=A0A9W4XKH0_9PLEO|nr:unnamed protein product [Periconia digitata]
MLILYFVALYVTVATVVAQPGLIPRYRAPGVAFRLTPDYGLASIYLKNGTSVPVAQVWGTLGYQDFMRKPLHSAWESRSTLCRYITPGLEQLIPLFGSWISICRNSKVESTLSVMDSLKTAVEAYLGTSICDVKLNIDVFEWPKHQVVREALHALGLREVVPTMPTTKSVVLEHVPHMGTTPGYNEEPWIILAIDYSKHWYNVGLMNIDEGFVDPIPGFIRGPTIGKGQQLKAVEHSLRDIIANPPDNIRNLPKQIHRVMLYGDDAKDDSLRELLIRLLGKMLVRNALISNSIFDGTNYTAYTAYYHMDIVNYPRPPWGCRWRSNFYIDPEGDEVKAEL